MNSEEDSDSTAIVSEEEGGDDSLTQGEEGESDEDLGESIGDGSLDTEEGSPEVIAEDIYDQKEGVEEGEDLPLYSEEKPEVSDGSIPSETMSSNEDKELFEGPQLAQESVVKEVVSAPERKQTFIPVKKMKSSHFQRAGVNVNRLYIVRPGQDMVFVAGQLGATEDLLYGINPHFRNKSLKVGDKVYYSSTKSPDDMEMKSYYEEMGVAPQYYTTQEGENIRSLGEKLLGHKRSWMEIWATNPDVVSKGRLPAGTQLRYWPEGGASLMADSTQEEPVETPPTKETSPNEEYVEATDTLEQIPVPTGDSTVMEGPQKEDMGEVSPMASTVGESNLPPSPPPNPPSHLSGLDKPKVPQVSGSVYGEDQDDQLMMVGMVSCMLLAALVFMIFIRRNRSKRVSFNP